MDGEIGIFVNGISGVFIGMAVLYLTMKIIALATIEQPESADKDSHGRS